MKALSRQTIIKLLRISDKEKIHKWPEQQEQQQNSYHVQRKEGKQETMENI